MECCWLGIGRVSVEYRRMSIVGGVFELEHTTYVQTSCFFHY